MLGIGLGLEFRVYYVGLGLRFKVFLDFLFYGLEFEV